MYNKAIMFVLFLVIVSIIITLVVGYYIFSRKDKEALLRLQPPETAWFEVKLPADYSDSEAKIARFYANIKDLLITDAKAREAGLGVLHLEAFAETPKNKVIPEVSFVVGCAADKLNDIKSRLTTSYGTDLVLLDLPADPFTEELEKTKTLVPITRPFEEFREKMEAKKAAKAQLKAQAKAEKQAGGQEQTRNPFG